MSILDELEHLARSLDPDQLAVYADALQRAGDPRGSLIAIDLTVAAGGSTDELDTEREVLLWTWLGEHGDLAQSPAVEIRFGYVHLDFTSIAQDELVRAIRKSPLAAWTTRVRAQGHLSEQLSGPAWPRLSRLELEDVAFDNIQLATLETLRELVVTEDRWHSFHRVLDLAGLEYLNLHSHEALATLRSSHLPAVGELVLAMTDAGSSDLERLELPADRWPALRRLDISGCRLDGGYFYGETSIDHPLIQQLDRLGVAPQLTHLRLPPIVTAADRDAVESARRRMARLTELI